MTKQFNLHQAAIDGDFTQFMQLVNDGASLTSVNENGYSPLHLVTLYKHEEWFKHPEFLKLLTQRIINYPDSQKFTPVQYLFKNFILDSSEQALHALENILEIGLKIDTFDSHLPSPLVYYYKKVYDLDDRHDPKKLEALNKLISNNILKLDPATLEKCNAYRKLFVIFGGRKLINNFNFFNSFNTGGVGRESMSLLQKTLNNFVSTYYPNNSSLLKIAKTTKENFFNIEKAKPYYICQKLTEGETLLTDTGSATHLIGASFQKDDNDIVLSLYERGQVWGKVTDSGKISGIKSIRFPFNQNTLTKIIEKLAEASNSASDDASYKIFFTDIPKITGTSFKLENSDGKELFSWPFKSGICFFANLKSAIHDLFFRFTNDGLLKYKEFDIYLHKSILEEFKKTVLSNERISGLTQLCENIIAEKQKQYKIDLAIKNDNMDELKKLLNLDDNNWNAKNIYHAITSVHSKKSIIEWLKNSGFDFNTKDYNNETLLHQCIEKNDFNTCIKILRCCNLTLSDENGNTPLHFILSYFSDQWISNPTILNMLTPELINIRNHAGKTLLHLAVEIGNLDLYLDLIKRGGDDSITDKERATPIHMVAEECQFNWFLDPKFQALLTKEKINQQDIFGNTALHYLFCRVPTIVNDNIAAADKLIELGADLNIKNKYKCTPRVMLYKKLHHLNGALVDVVASINLLLKNPQSKVKISDLNKFNATRQLFVLFGGAELLSKIGDLDEFYCGGLLEEGVKFLNNNLEAFVDKYFPKDESLLSLSTLFKNQFSIFSAFLAEQNKYVNEILNGKIRIIECGSSDKMVFASFERQGNDIILSIAESEEWVKRHPANNKVSGLQHLRFPANEATLNTVIQLLDKANHSSSNDAYNIIFKQLPQTIHHDFVNTNCMGKEILTKHRQGNIIEFFLNAKLMLKDFFYRFVKDGEQRYEEFNVFMHEAALRNYLQVFDAKDQNDKLVKLCQDSLDKMQKHLEPEPVPTNPNLDKSSSANIPEKALVSNIFTLFTTSKKTHSDSDRDVDSLGKCSRISY